MIGVSGGGGDPLCARVVDVEAVELRRLTPAGFGMFKAGCPGAAVVPPPAGAGQYCWWYSGNGLGSALAFRCGGIWNNPSLSGVSGPGESGRGLGAVPLRSASFEGCIEPSAALPTP